MECIQEWFAKKGSISTDNEQSDLKALKLVDEIYTSHPYFGTRMMLAELEDHDINVGRQNIRKYYRLLGLEAVYPKVNNKFTAVTVVIFKDHPIHIPLGAYCS